MHFCRCKIFLLKKTPFLRKKVWIFFFKIFLRIIGLSLKKWKIKNPHNPAPKPLFFFCVFFSFFLLLKYATFLKKCTFFCVFHSFQKRDAIPHAPFLKRAKMTSSFSRISHLFCLFSFFSKKWKKSFLKKKRTNGFDPGYLLKTWKKEIKKKWKKRLFLGIFFTQNRHF